MDACTHISLRLWEPEMLATCYWRGMSSSVCMAKNMWTPQHLRHKLSVGAAGWETDERRTGFCHHALQEKTQNVENRLDISRFKPPQQNVLCRRVGETVLLINTVYDSPNDVVTSETEARTARKQVWINVTGLMDQKSWLPSWHLDLIHEIVPRLCELFEPTVTLQSERYTLRM